MSQDTMDAEREGAMRERRRVLRIVNKELRARERLGLFDGANALGWVLDKIKRKATKE